MTHLKFGDTIIALDGIQTVAKVANGVYPYGFEGDGRWSNGVVVRYENGAMIGIDSWDLVGDRNREKLKQEHGFVSKEFQVVPPELTRALWDKSEDATIKAIEQINEALKQTE